jgi:hypothetical protein
MSNFVKHDNGKIKWSMFPWRAAAKMMAVVAHGAAKYGHDNWRNAEPDEAERYVDAAARHIIAYFEGEKIDPDSGNPHLWHAMCSLAFYLEYDTCISTTQGHQNSGLATESSPLTTS